MGTRDEEALRRFVACRERADGDGMARAWEELVVELHDRIVALVGIQGSRTGMARAEQDDVVQDVHINAWKFAETFGGTSMGELHMALVTMVRRRCADHIRARISERERRAALDAGWGEPDGDADGRPSAAEVDEAWAQHDRRAERAEAGDFVAWALPQIANERRRLVLQRDLEGVPAEAIAVELRVTMPNLYQLRRRANQDLRVLHEEYFS